jgi:hypothetical protein
MSDEPMTLVCMRLCDMHVMHPEQIHELCSKCQHVVGVYPSGQRAMLKHPEMKILCAICANLNVLPGGDEVSIECIPAGSIEEIIQEKRESFPVEKA